MYDNLIKQLNEKFPEKTFTVEEDDGLYSISTDDQMFLKWRDPLSKDEHAKSKMESIIFDTVIESLQYMTHRSYGL